MKIVYAIFIVFILGLICTKQSPANVTLDGTCVEKCLRDGHTINYCRVECTKFN